MNRFFVLKPDVAGGWGNRTEADTSQHPPLVQKLHYEFEGWSGDELVTSFPCFLVSDGLGKSIQNEKLGGFSLAAAEVTASPEFREISPNKELPLFWWLKIDGVAGQDDFGISENHRLVVSERALQILQKHNISQCGVVEWRR